MPIGKQPHAPFHAPYGGRLADHTRQMAAARQHMERVHAAAVAVGATLVGDEIIMTPGQVAEFDRIMAGETPPPA